MVFEGKLFFIEVQLMNAGVFFKKISNCCFIHTNRIKSLKNEHSWRLKAFSEGMMANLDKEDTPSTH